MNAVARFWDESRVLVATTLRTWRSLLPLLLLLQLLGWFSYQASMSTAAVLSFDHPWISLGIFSLGFVLSLVVAVVMLRVVGDKLGTAEMVPDAPPDQEEGRIGLTRMLVLTLLPLLAMYAAFGYVGDAVNELTLITFVYYGSLGDNLLAVLNPDRAGVGTVLAVLLGAYILRRVLDLIHDRTGWRWMGILVTVTEAFFVMGLVLAASRWFSNLNFWLRNRQFRAWWDEGIAGLSTAFDAIRIDLPAFLAWVVPLWEDLISSSLLKAVTEPLLWLAVAALVFGSRVVSVADMWRKGQPLASQVPGARRLTLVRKMALTAETRPARENGVGRRVGLWLQETLLGDIDDKYLPTLHALRLVLKAGLPFLTAFVLLHNATSVAKSLLTTALVDVAGGHPTVIWTGLLPGIELVVGLLLETVRLTLLAVGFHRCLQLFRAHAHPSDNPVPAPMPKKRVSTFVLTTWRKLRGSLALLLAAFAVSTAGWMLAEHLGDNIYDYRDGVVGETVAVGPVDITVDDVRYGQVIASSRGGVVVSNSRWVVVSVRASATGEGDGLAATLLGPGNKEYRHEGGMVVVDDSKWTEYEMLFEVDPDDIGDLALRIAPSSDTVVRNPATRIHLGPEDDQAQQVIDDSRWRSLIYQRYPVSGGN